MKEENGYSEARISKGKGARGSNGPLGVGFVHPGNSHLWVLPLYALWALNFVVFLLQVEAAWDAFCLWVMLRWLLRWSGAIRRALWSQLEAASAIPGTSCLEMD
ncbi:hypothetical protein COLO4_37691 [Corchorus olitorius]|uniref:Uncharacterized protein n=1 Tax=Corchorus olitorius TaxID=93759 RepID=A0A1R3FZY3_9ROSI|nr:hypothetical protein COLO4_37691 [Corchorus olitorius]